MTAKKGRPESRIIIDHPDMVISQVDAMQLGFTVYRTGDPCKRGHTGWRRTATTRCIECEKAARLGEKPAPEDLSQRLKIAQEARKAAVSAEKKLLREIKKTDKKLPKKNTRDKEQRVKNSRLMKYRPNTILSREDAIKQGLGVFRTGNPCSKGHNGWQYVMNLLCVTCVAMLKPGALRKQYQHFRR